MCVHALIFWTILVLVVQMADQGLYQIIFLSNCKQNFISFVELQAIGLGLGVDFTFAWDNNNNNTNPHLNFWKGTALGDKEQGVGIRDKG